jgi:choline-sulfatase
MSEVATHWHPNILIIMSDEHAPQFSEFHGHPLVRTPHMDRLSARGVTFDNAYCNTPICVASRMSFLTGRYVHHNGAWDNSAPLATDAVTWPHLLRANGYDVVLSGKQHFVGPDKLHGFRAQLARELHAENTHPTFDWTDGTPPAPLMVAQCYWDMYPLADIDMPNIPDGHLESQHPAYQRMRSMFGYVDFPEDLVRRGRAGYYGLITYLDDKVGRLLDALDEIG